MDIEFITSNPQAVHFPPVPAKKFVPDWYKNLPEHTMEDRYVDDAVYISERQLYTTKTIKGCIPVTDYITSGYIIRAYSQILFTPRMMGDVSAYAYISADGKLGSHPHEQCPVKIDNEKKFYMKIMNPWMVKVPAGYSCLFYQPAFFMEKRYTLFPAIVDCDEFDEVINFPGYINARDSFYINPGDPVMAVFPFKRDEWNSNVRMMTEKEKQKPSIMKSYLHTKYKKIFHKKKSYK